LEKIFRKKWASGWYCSRMCITMYCSESVTVNILVNKAGWCFDDTSDQAIWLLRARFHRFMCPRCFHVPQTPRSWIMPHHVSSHIWSHWHGMITQQASAWLTNLASNYTYSILIPLGDRLCWQRCITLYWIPFKFFSEMF